MSRQLSLRFLVFSILIVPVTGLAQTPTWTGIIAPTRAANWANAGVPGGIPARTTFCATIAPEGTSATPVPPTNINSAISSCPSGEVVLLQAGKYYFNAPIDFGEGSTALNNVTLRGAGADQTLLYFTGGDQCLSSPGAGVCLESHNTAYNTGNGQGAAWTAGYSQAATSITLTDSSNIIVGTTIYLNQCDDGITSSSGGTCNTGTAADSGQVFNCETTGLCSANGGGGASVPNAAQFQLVKVTACSPSCNYSGSTVLTISPGLYMSNWNSTHSPFAWWSENLIAAGAQQQSVGLGVENMTIDMSKSTENQVEGTGVLIMWCYGCWVTGTRIVNTTRAHVELYYGAAHDTVASNYLYGTQNAATLSYGVENYAGSDNLIVNNIGQHTVSPLISGGADEGDVWAYNFSIDDYFTLEGGYYMPSDWEHAVGSAMDLHEGNQGLGFIADDEHGTHNLATVFRSFATGNQPSCYGYACVGNNTVLKASYSRYFNWIGNVGGSSIYTVYSSYPSSTTSTGPSGYTVYSMGYGGYGNQYNSSIGPNDYPLGQQSLMMWGNCDYVNSFVCQFNSGEVPSSFNDTTGSPSIYANPLPSSHALPPSFFLSSQPSWWTTPWGTPPWPAIGPDVTGGNIAGSGGHANNIPAELCYANSPVDPAYQFGYAVSAATWSNGTATLTIATIPQVPQGEITVTGVTPPGYNGTFQITASTTTSVSYAVASNPSAYSSGGSVGYPNVRIFNVANCYGQSTLAAQPNPPTTVNAVVSN